jgi:hypothetical protein
MNEKYYIKNKALAFAISYFCNQDFFVYDDKFDSGKKVYCFIRTDKFEKAMELLPEIRKQFN